MRNFLREFPFEPNFERSLFASPSLRNFLLRVTPSMEEGPKREVLEKILFGKDYDDACRAAKALASVREAWASDLIDAALRSHLAPTRYAALRGSDGCHESILVPRLRRAVADADQEIRTYAQKQLQSYRRSASSGDLRVQCQICGQRIHPIAMALHQAEHRSNRVIDPEKDKPEVVARAGTERRGYPMGKPERWEWEMTTINTSTYRRK